MEKNKEIRSFLKIVGIKPSVKGYHFLVTAIDIAVKHFKQGKPISVCTIYREVGEIHDERHNNVERCIRHSVKLAWDADTEMMKELFKWNPTNGDFICVVAEYLYLKGFGDE